MVDNHPSVALPHVRETETRIVGGDLAGLVVGEGVRAAVDGDIAKNPNVLLTESDALIRALRHTAEILPSRCRSVAQSG